MPICREIMTAEVATLAPEMSLREAVEVLRGAEVSGAPVLAGGEVVGVVSGSDILEFEALTAGVPTERTEMLGVEDSDVSEEWRAGDPPASYFLGLWSDAGADVFERFSETDGPEWDMLEEHTVSEVMSESIRSVEPDTPLRDAARYMVETGVHRVLVLEDGSLAGIVTATDFVRALAEDLL